jgi:hypothetical protein
MKKRRFHLGRIKLRRNELWCLLQDVVIIVSMEMKLMRHQDHDDDDEFLQNLPLKTMDEFNFFDEEINNKSIRKILVRNNFATNIILIVFLIFSIISFFSIII